MGVPPNLQLTGVDAAVWTFDVDEPITLKAVSGLGGASYTFDDMKSVGQAGVTWVARNDDPNVTTMLCNFKVDDTGANRLAMLDDWLTSLGRGTAATSGGPLMELRCLDSARFQQKRLVNVLDPPYPQIYSVGFWRFEMQLRSDETWWRKAPFTDSFTAAEFAAATVDNLSDEPVWPHLKLTGPITTPVIGWAGDTVTLPNVAAGDFLDIETDPNRWAILDDAGVDQSWIGDRWYTKIPKGAAVPLTITGSGTTGATLLEVTVPQLYYRAL